MRRTVPVLCLVLGLASICLGSAWLGSKLALDHLAAGSLPVDLRSGLEVDYHGEATPSYLPPLEASVSQQAQEDEARLAVRFSGQDLEFVPVFSSLPDWQAVPTPGWMLTPEAAPTTEEPATASMPEPGAESATEGSTSPGSTRESLVDRYGPFADADTWIAEDAGQTNYSGADELHVSNSAGHRERILLDIRPLGLTGSATLERAVLHIYMASSTGTGASVTVNRVTAAWDPAAATWESVMGGRFDAEPATTIDTASAGWKTLDITPLMRKWLDGSAGSYGVILTAPAAGEDATATFCSSNHPDPLLRPWLEVRFTAPNGP